MAPSPLSLVAQSSALHMRARAYFSRAWINLAASVKRAYAFCILCLLTVLGASCVFSVHVSFHLAAIRASSPFPHSPSLYEPAGGILLNSEDPQVSWNGPALRKPLAPNLFKPTDCTSRSLSRQLLPSATLCSRMVSPQTSRNLPPWPPSPLQCCSC